MYSEKVEERLKEFIELYGIAENAYKRLQTLLDQIDDKIHNEFKYCSRGLKEFLSKSCETTDDEKLEHLQKSTHAIKNAFNDSIDLILGYATIRIKELSSIDTGKEFIVFVPNIAKILESTVSIHTKIAESRANLENRIQTYKDILESDEFRLIVDFCEAIPIIENNISSEYSRAIYERRKFITQLTVTIVIGLVGFAAQIPNIVKFLAQFCPWIAQFSHF